MEEIRLGAIFPTDLMNVGGLVVGAGYSGSIASWVSKQFGLVGDVAVLLPAFLMMWQGGRLHPAVRWAGLGMLVSWGALRIKGLTVPTQGSPSPQGGSPQLTIDQLAQQYERTR